MLKKKYAFIILVIIIGSAIWLENTEKKSTILVDNNFEIADTSVVTKVFIADRYGNTITVEKVEKKWFVNEKYEARKDAIKTLLTTISKIKIKKPVSNSSFDNVVKFMATSGIKVEIYDANNLLKSYTIGSNTADHLGTYMLLKDAAKPYIMHIPSFNGFLSPRYGIQGQKIDVKTWRSNKVFSSKQEDIERIYFTDLLNPENSYKLTTSPMILSSNSIMKIDYNINSTLGLLNSFENLNCESFKEKYKIEFATQLHELIVNSDTLRTYQIKKDTVKIKSENFTVERMYATLNNSDVMLIQDYVFNKVLITLNELKN